jgi:hypothetical protein
MPSSELSALLTNELLTGGAVRPGHASTTISELANRKNDAHPSRTHRDTWLPRANRVPFAVWLLLRERGEGLAGTQSRGLDGFRGLESC